MATRLNKYISESGICSRREADRYIEQGHVFVNGKRASVGTQVTGKDRVVVNGSVIEPRGEEEIVYIAYNKPPGVTTTTTAGVKSNINSAIRHSARLVPVGQLDKDAQGLVLLTNNGELVNSILRASHVHENEYVVMLDKPITEQFLEALAAGAGQPGAERQNIRVTKDTPYIFRIALLHDTIRQIERWCEQFGYKVVQMERIRVMNVSVKALGVGEWRDLRAGELKVLQETVAQAGTAPGGSSAPRRKRPSTAAFWGSERPAATSPDSEKKPRRPSAPRPEDEWLELPAEPKPARAPRAGGSRPAGRPTGAGRPAGKTTGRPTRGGSARSGGGPGNSAGAAGKASNRGSRGAGRGGKRA